MAAGVLVCGGGSTRFGDDDKVCFPLAGKPLVRHVADRLVPVIDELVVNCRTDQHEALEEALDGYPHEVTYTFDERADAGPLHGIGQGLRGTDETFAVVVACDMPFVDPGFVEYLFEVAEGHEAAIPKQGDERWFQPLQAVYQVDAMCSAIDAAVDEGMDRPINAARKLDVRTVEGEELRDRADEWTFFNVNTRADLEEAAAHLADE